MSNVVNWGRLMLVDSIDGTIDVNFDEIGDQKIDKILLFDCMFGVKCEKIDVRKTKNKMNRKIQNFHLRRCHNLNDTNLNSGLIQIYDE